jgi:hypothetical protein
MAIGNRKGIVIIFVLALAATFLLIITALINLSYSEIIQAKNRNNAIQSYYVAAAGAERMYARLKNIQATGGTVTWPISPSSLNNAAVQVGGSTVGTFTATANITGQTDEFMIISTGAVNGRSSTVTVKYGYTDTYTNGIPIGSMGAMNFAGNKWWFLTSRVYADGPIESASNITPSVSCPNSSPYVQFNGDVTPNNSNLSNPSYWYKYDSATNSWSQKQVYDTNGNGQHLTDTTNKGYVDISDAGGNADKIAIFNADDINSDGRIDTKDAFISYYTVELNSQYNLGINKGGPNYYSGEHTFGPYNVPTGTSVIFVDGDANIIFNAQKWWGNKADLTVVSTNDITIVQPVNGADDRTTTIAYGDTITGGLNLGDLADVDGNLNMYSNGNFTAILGGSTNGSIMVGGITNVNTGLPSFLFNRDINQGNDDWSNPANIPRGLPPGYSQISKVFVIKPENFSLSGYKPRWQWR